MEKKINDFIIFCMEIYKNKEKITGKEVYDLFEKFGVFNYLEEGYDMLHTQGSEWMIDDIEEFLNQRGFSKLKENTNVEDLVCNKENIEDSENLGENK